MKTFTATLAPLAAAALLSACATVGGPDARTASIQRTANGELEVSTTGHQGSHVFSSFSQGNCFIVLERDRGNVEAGEWVEVEPFNALFGGL